jgi:hypothetical protein
VEPFTSRDAALARLQERVNEFSKVNESWQTYLFRSAIKYGTVVPPALHEAVGKVQIKGSEIMVAKAKKELADAEASLAKALEEFSEVSK